MNGQTKMFLAVAVVAGIVLLAPLAQATSFVSVSLTVVDSMTSSPVPNATVSIYNATTKSLLASGSTGSTGKFATLLGGGWSTIITVNATGFKNYQTKYLVSASNSSLLLPLKEATVPVKILVTGPSGVSATVDSSSTTLPATENWLMGSTHTVSVPSQVPVSTGTAYVFSGWTGLSTSTSPSVTLTVSGNGSLTANYILEYQLSVSSTSGGTVSPSSGGYFPSGSSVTVTATPSSGYRFVSWLVDGIFQATANPLTLMMNSPHSVSANFSLATVRVTFQGNIPGSIPAAIVVDGVGESLPFTTTWQVGSSHSVQVRGHISGGTGIQYVFQSWTPSSVPQNFSITASSSATYTVSFSTYYLLSVAYTKSTGTVSTNSTWVLAGNSATLTATAAQNYRFDHWLVDGTNYYANPITVTMNSPHSVQAFFILNAVKVGFLVQGLPNARVTVDGTSYSTPQFLTLTIGTQHSVVVQTYVYSSNTTRSVLVSVLLNAVQLPVQNFTITASSPANYTFVYKAQEYLTVRTYQGLTPSGGGWYFKGANVSLSSPSSVSLADGSLLVLRGYVLDGVFLRGGGFVLVMNSPHSVAWQYVKEWRLTLNAISTDGSDLGSSAVFKLATQQGVLTLPNHNSTFWPAGVSYSVSLLYAGQVANSTTITLSSNVVFTVKVPNTGSAGGFRAVAQNGFIQSMGWDPSRSVLTVSASAVNGTLSIYVPQGAFPQDFFIVNVNGSSWNPASRTLTLHIAGSVSVSLTEPQGTIISLSESDIATVSVNGHVLNQFRISYIPSTPPFYGVYFQTQTEPISAEVARPFVPLNDPTNTYSILIGFFTNGRALIAVNSGVTNIAVTTSLYSPSYGQLIQLDPKSVPGAFRVEVPLQKGVRYNIVLNQQNFAAVEWDLAQNGLPLFTVYGLNDQPIASAIATAIGIPFLAVGGGAGGQSIALEMTTSTPQSVIVEVLGTSQPSVSQLPGGQYGSQQLSLQTDAVAQAGQYQVQSDLWGSWPWVTVDWQVPAGITNFSVSINGISGIRLTNSSTSPIDQRYGLVRVFPSSGTAYIKFVPRQSGTYTVTVNGAGFSGTYTGSITIQAYDNGLRTSLPASGFVLIFIGGVAYLFAKRRSSGIITETMIP